MDYKIDVSATQPTLSYDPVRKQVAIQAELVSFGPQGSARSGENIRLGLTAADAMTLLSYLELVRQKEGLSPPSAPVVEISVPPNKEQN